MDDRRRNYDFVVRHHLVDTRNRREKNRGREMSTVSEAVRVLREGGLIAFPTETVYGLGADATNADAVAKIFRAKGRPSTNPLIVHVGNVTIAKRYAKVW